MSDVNESEKRRKGVSQRSGVSRKWKRLFILRGSRSRKTKGGTKALNNNDDLLSLFVNVNTFSPQTAL